MKCFHLLESKCRCLSALVLSVSTLASAPLVWGQAADVPTYNQDIRPILSKNCFTCHGPDSAARKADLRLDVREDAVAEEAIVPGDATASALVARILTEDPNDVMPPPETKLSLTAAQKETLQRWIAAGAPYEKHWAFIPPEAPEIPAISNTTSPVDALVRERLNRLGLSSNPEASRETLIRRVAFDLTGLPPTLEEIDAFLSDPSPTAYETMVDRYLARPAYGEHMAGLWLDVARYADTYGYQNDRESNVWPWRDWVIDAFNANMPYDQFVTEQVAGDLLPGATQSQRLATAFNRLHRQTNEGGSIDEEFRVAYVADRSETFSTAFLGLTMSCARCHDHKFDPLSQKNYFQLFAFFDSIDESGMYSHFTNAVPSPSMFLYRNDEEARHKALRVAILEAEEALEQTETAAADRFAAWRGDGERAVPVPTPVVSLSFETIEEGKTPDGAAERSASLTRGPAQVTGPVGQALQFDGDDGVSLQDKAAGFDRYQPVSFGIWVRSSKQVPRQVIFHRTKAAEDAASRGYELLLLDGKPTFSLCHFWPGNAIRVQATESLPLDTWTHLAVTYDGSSRAHGVTLYVNGKEVPTEVVRDGLAKTILYEGEEDTPVQLAMRFRDKGFKGGRLDEFTIYDRCLTSLEVASVAGQGNLIAAVEQRIATGEDDGALQDYYARVVDEPFQAAHAALTSAREEEAKFAGSLQSVMVMEEMEGGRTAYLLERGEYNHRGAEVGPGTPESILPMPEDLPQNRLGLAQWLVHPDNPLTARVAVNRLWQQCFGRGIVKTQEDFGTQGALPSNPALLDYLAIRFVDSGWDMKALLREIVCSATYKQASETTPELLERDPDNAFLARGPRIRLRAEQIRDNALASAGLLVPKVGGPSVKPYQPEGLWKESSGQVYTPSEGEGLYRRSLYTFIKRTVPPPSMLNFNATSREVCLVRRESTVTPLQALVLLNDPQYVEAARVLAATTLPEANGGDEAWVTTMFRRLTGRSPDDAEKEILRSALAAQREEFARDPEGAAAYLSTGTQPIPEGVDGPQLAAGTALAQAIMNFEEFQVKQ